MESNLAMSTGFSKRIHQALRSWSNQGSTEVLADLQLARQIKAENSGMMARLVCNQILLDGLEQLQQFDPTGAKLLEDRFINEETVQTIAYRRNQSDNIVQIQQRQAIASLAEIIWEQEAVLRRERLSRIETRLDVSSHGQLFGVGEKLAEIQAKLKSPEAHWLITLEGLGGIGKTSLAAAIIRQLALTDHFEEIGWVTARRQRFILPGDIHSLPHQPQLTVSELVEQLIEQFGLTSLKRETESQQQIGLKQLFKEKPCLVVVDNLDTVKDAYTLALQLRNWVTPTKFLITTRQPVRGIDGLLAITVQELGRDDIAQLIQHEADIKGLYTLTQLTEAELDQIYSLTGGNPLAVKLLIGQLETLTLSDVLHNFKTQQGKPIQTLLTYIYDQAWQALPDLTRSVLLAMVFTAESGATLAQIAATAEKNEAETMTALQTLSQHSLVNVHGDLREKRYSIHQLTHTFLMQKIA